MKLIVLVLAAFALGVTAAPLDVEPAAVEEAADVTEPLESRDNWCHHAGISCW